ncbi:ATP-binding protein [Sandaracinus amylolyticus]|uniref:DNA polymerase III subunit n=1 Tax=Sandaracinus amylolyticus TaxID=927083 RepID=UPI001F1D232E|nr:DNA polymerase III subunit delta' [Sandaracinus amylolyticus]UJR80614.1 DNA polymerase III delta prime subunit [Sandaracinus amylolyticus]
MADPFEAILAQDTAVAILRAAVARNRLPSAYLFEGPSGVGKQKAAIALAQAIIGADAPDASRAEVLRRIGAGTHPDVRLFRPRDEGDRNIQVDTVREQILPFAQYAPFEAKHAFLILPEADVSFPENHPEGANALLKTLEEPRPGVHFVLLAERPDRLLVTIRSRCQKVRFARLPPNALATILDRESADAAHRTAAIALADGRADRAISLSQEGAADALLEGALRIDEVTSRGVPGELIGLAEELAKNADVEHVLDALSTYYRDVAAAALGLPDDALAFRHQAERIRARAEVVGAERAARACERIRDAEERLEQNANKEILLGRVLFEIGR